MEIIKCFACFYLLYMQEFGVTETKKHRKDVYQSKVIHYRERRANSGQNVHLRGRFSDNTGIVEVKPKGSPLWGAVCGDRFTEQDARVVCREILHTYHVYPTRLTISDPASYGYYRLVWYSQLGCQHESASLQFCNVSIVDVEAIFRCQNTQSYAAVCCKTSTEPGVYSEDRTLYTTHCPHTWVEAKNRICLKGYSNIKYNDSRLIPFLNTSWLWTSSKMKISEMNASLCESKISGILGKDTLRHCSSICQYCLRKERQYYLKQGDNCSCLKDDDICRNITKNSINTCPENCTDATNSTCPENCTSYERSGPKIFHIIITEVIVSVEYKSANINVQDDDSNISSCIQVRFDNGARHYNIIDCGVLQQTVCLKKSFYVSTSTTRPKSAAGWLEINTLLRQVIQVAICCCAATVIFVVRNKINHRYSAKQQSSENESFYVSLSTTRYSTKQQSSENDLVVPVAAGLGTTLALTIVVSVAVVLYCRRRKAPSAITDEMYRGYKNRKRSPIPQPRVDTDNAEQQDTDHYDNIKSNEMDDDITEDGHYTSPRFSDGAYSSIADTPVSKSDNKDVYLTPTLEDREMFDRHGYLLPKCGQAPKYIEVQDA